jgi:DNA polymerase-1
MSAKLVGVSLSVEPGSACYIPLGHKLGNESDQDSFDKVSQEENSSAQIPLQEALALLKPLLEDPHVLKIGQNLKYDMVVLARSPYPIHMYPIDDTMIMSFVLDAGRGSHGMDALSQLHLDITPISYKTVVGTGKHQLTFDQVSLGTACEYAAEDADITLRLADFLRPRLVSEQMTTVYQTIERPLALVLAEMEQNGVLVDRDTLIGLSEDFESRIDMLAIDIYKLAGREFTIGSPKQLGEVLFDEMGLEGGKKTKTGAYGTGAEVLEALAFQGHDLPRRVLEWRKLSKLKSTYADALIGQINPGTGRVHTSYSMAGASTGRLSSTDPNLQNIPVRTDEGRKIRGAFVAAPHHRLLSADYSQIELRLLAHIADIDVLRDAFKRDEDIHALTASQVFDVSLDRVDPLVRRRAKAINFGIIYGQSAFGLANQLNIPQKEAKKYIESYFERYPGIGTYMDSTKEFARSHGFVETIFGRRCHVMAIADKNPARRGYAERQAINAPIQGSAADIIKRAMIRMSPALVDAGLSAKMLLQVHDELLFEVPETELDRTIEVVSTVMESAALPACELRVPLTVDVGHGENWDVAH